MANKPLNSKKTKLEKDLTKSSQINIKKVKRKTTQGDDTVKTIDIDKIKREVRSSRWSITGLKFVTVESKRDVIRSIKRELPNYAHTVRFIVKYPTIELGLSNNATACIYYFFDKETFDKTVEELHQFQKEVVKL